MSLTTTQPVAAGEVTGISLRPVSGDDEAFLSEVFLSARPDLMLLPLEPTDVQILVNLQVRGQRASYLTAHPGAVDHVIERDRRPVGRLFLHEDHEAVTVLDVVVLPEFRNQGVGGSVLADVVDLAGSRVVRLHVENGNPARRLYERLGFHLISETGTGCQMERRPRPREVIDSVRSEPVGGVW